MEAKDKAYKLVNIFWKMTDYTGDSFGKAKLCAHVVVDEIIGQWEYIDTYLADGQGELNPNLRYWLEVKQEVDKLYD